MADSTETRALLLQISANTELLRSNLSEAEKSVKSFQEHTQKHLDDSDARFKLLGKSIESLEKPLEKLKSLGEVALAGLFGESLLHKGREALEFAGNIEFMSKQLGVSTDFLQKFRYAAGQFGVGTEEAQTGLGRFTRSIGEAANGNSKLIKLFDSLGVKVRDSNGAVRSTEAVYNDFANAIAKVDNPAQRVADTMAAFGRGAIGLVPMLAEGSEGFKKLADAAKDLGIVLSPEMIENSEKVNHKLAELKMILDAQMASAVAQNANAIDSLAESIGRLTGKLLKFAEAHPYEAGAAIGALAGFMRGGPQGAVVGAGIGVVGVELAQDNGDGNNSIKYRRQKLREARDRYHADIALTSSETFAQSLITVHDANTPTASDAPRAFREFQKQVGLLKSALGHPENKALGTGSNAPGATNDNGEALKAAEKDLTDLEKAKVGKSGAVLAAYNDEISLKKREIGFLNSGADASMAKSLASKEGAAIAKGESAAKRDAAKAERDALAYQQEELGLRKKLIEGAKKSNANDTARDVLEKEIVDLDAMGVKEKVATQLKAKSISAAEAKHLLDLNEQARTQGKLNIDLAARERDAKEALKSLELDLRGQEAILNLDDRLATTRKQRLDIELRLLTLQENLAKAVQQEIIDNKGGKYSPDQIADARRIVAQIDDQHGRNVEQVQRNNAAPLDAYRLQLQQATGDMKDSLQTVAVDGLGSIESGFVGVISGTQSVASAFKNMANTIIADLARIAIEKLIVNALGGTFLGGLLHADGGPIQAHAAGGAIVGPGGPRSDSIPAWLSNGEYVINAEAAAMIGRPTLDALNSRRHYADGGPVSPGAIFSPRISGSDIAAIAASRAGGGGTTINATIDARGATDPAMVQRMVMDGIAQTAPVIIAAAKGQTLAAVARTPLASSLG